MKKHVFLKTLLSSLMVISTMSAAVTPVVAEDAETEAEVTEIVEATEEVEETEEVVAETQDSEEGEETEIDIEIEEEEEEESAIGSGSIEFDADADEVTVTAAAPEGAFPEGTEMTAETVTDPEVLDLIKNAVGEDATILAAVDITFTSEGEAVQPDEAVKVAFAANGIVYSENLKIVHVDDKGEELIATVLDQEPVKTEDGGVAFDADSFSVYAVVDGSTGEEARATVNFWGFPKGEKPVATVYVKNGDDAEHIQMIVYDPGVGGSLKAPYLFQGWSTVENYTLETPTKSIDEIRTDLLSVNATEGDTVIDYYPVVYKAFTIKYLDPIGVGLGGEDILVLPTTDSTSYTIQKEDYTSTVQTKNFDGWSVDEGAGNISNASNAAPYPFETTMTISGNVTFRAHEQEGHWLIFDENGDHAKYNAPAFIEDGKTCKADEPNAAEMLRPGYTFAGWYTDPVGGTLFDFDSTLDEAGDAGVTIYAHWTMVTSADYIVLIWKQSLAGGNSYDYETVVSLSGTPNTTVNTVTQQGTGNSAYARVNGTNIQFTGFHLANFDQNVTISPQGNTVLNVYYDRNQHTLTFQDHPYTETTSGSGTQYGLVDGEYVLLTRYGNNNYWYNGERYYGTRYTRGTGWVTVKEITALYDQSIGSNFPIVGTNGATYDNGERWDPQSNTPYSEVLVYIDVMPDADVTFHLDTEDRDTKHIHYYVETLAGETPDRTYNGMGFTEYKSVDADYTFFTEAEDYITLVGFSKSNSYPPEAYNSNGIKLNSVWNNNNAVDVYCYYLRKVFTLNFMDGVYYDGDGNKINETNLGQLKEVTNIDYQSSIASYNVGQTNYYVPERTGYVFEGWYIDKGCTQKYTFTTMPEGGVTVYAKWIEEQYRVFLHPKADDVLDLDWGSETQQMNFRISYGKTVSLPTGRSQVYNFIGWYKDENTKVAYNKDTKLTEATVKTEYNKATDFTDPMDKYGHLGNNPENHDLNRPWIRYKLDLYGKWSAKIEGALGIRIIYDPTELGKEEPQDETLYGDNVDAIVGSAATAKDDTKQFLNWVVYKWNADINDFESTGVVKYPGDTFTVHLADARKEQVPDFDPDNPQYNYTIKLVAEYGDKEAPTPTHIDWYSNIVAMDGTELDLTKMAVSIAADKVEKGAKVKEDDEEGTLAKTKGKGVEYLDKMNINQHLGILDATTFTYSGGAYTFAGWSKDPNVSSVDDLFLRYTDGVGFETKVDDNWVSVSEVYADEKTPYDDLYAVWIGTYKIKWSSDLSLEEEYPINMGPTNEELVDSVNSDYLYGGYYKLTDEIEGLQAYTATTGQENYWKQSGFTAGTVAWSEQEKKSGDVYYVKEVPDHYLTPYLQYYYNNRYGKFLVDMYLVTAIDDTNYSKIGFGRLKAGVANVSDAALTILPDSMSTVYEDIYFKSDIENMKVKAGSSAEDEVAVTKVNNAVGYVANLNVVDFAHNQDEGVWYPIEKSFSNLTFNYVPYYVTLDGVTVLGKSVRTISTGLGYADTITVQAEESSTYGLNQIDVK